MPTLDLKRSESAGNGSVKIAQFTPRSQINAVPNSSNMQGQNFTGIGAALANVGRSIGNAGAQYEDDQKKQEIEKQRLLDIEIKKEKEKQALAASVNASESILKLQADLAEQQSQAKDGADGFANNIDDRINQHIDEATKDATPYYATEYRKNMQAAKQHFVGQAIEYQHNESLKYELDQIDSKIEKSTVAIKNDPALYDMLRDSTIDAINKNTKLLPDVKRDKITAARKQFSLSAGQGWIDTNPMGVLGDIKQAGGDYHMPNVSEKVMQYSDTVHAAAARTGVNPAIMLAQIDAESGGNSHAMSPKHAKGLTQFIDETAKRYNVDVTNPTSSIVGQSRYMGDLLNMFDGDYTKALAGYNWGEGNVKKSQDKYGADWLNHAPKETQNYVAKIMKATGGNTQHMDIGHEVVPMSLSGHEWYDNADVDTQNKLKAYAETKANGQVAQVGSDIATYIANSMVSDKPINLNEATKKTIEQIESKYGAVTPEQKTAIANATISAVSRAESNWNRNREGQLATAYDILDKTGGNYAELVAQNPDLVADMNTEQKNKLNEYAGKVVLGGNVATNWDKYSALIENPTFMIGKDLNALKGEMNTRELNQLKAIQKQVSDNPAKADNLKSDIAVINAELEKAGIKDKDKQGEFAAILQQKIDEELQAGAKVVTQEEKLKLTRDLLTEVVSVKRGYWFDKKQPLGTIQEIPAPLKARFTAALIYNKLPANDYNLLKQYKIYLDETNGKAQ